MSTTQLLKHKRINIYEDDVILPNGIETKYLHFGKAHHATLIIAINEDGKFLVQKEYSYPTDRWLYQFPGGAVEKGEKPIEGAMRELAEEGGYEGDLELVDSYFVGHRRSASRIYVYIARNLKPKEATKDPEEEFESYWFSEDEVDKLIGAGETPNGSLLSGWALYKARK